MNRAIRAALLLAAVAWAGTVRSAPAPAAPATHPPPNDTRCAACHTPEGWGNVKFIHERTGFPLTGQHASLACRKCHPQDFKEPLGRSCASCHRDVHAGYAGIHCDSCHDTQGWRSRFDADAHRRTNFPLQGRHALIPCEECHGDRRDRAFARPTVDCSVCHASDLSTAAAKGVNHSGFPSNCLGCHTFWRWSPASFTGHDRCFPIGSGRHANITCSRCHGVIPSPLEIRSCSSTPWPGCFSCHGGCSGVTPRHTGVPGFTCSDQRCYQCHPGGSADEGGGNLRSLKVRR